MNLVWAYTIVCSFVVLLTTILIIIDYYKNKKYNSEKDRTTIHRKYIINKVNKFINELKNNYISRYCFLRSIECDNINLNAVPYKFLFTFINYDLWREDIEKSNHIYCDVDLNFLELLEKD